MSKSIHRLIAVALAAVALGGVQPAAAQPLSRADSFRIGSGGSALCTAQLGIADPAAVGMFDRAYAIVCRDAAVQVGRLFALRSRDADPAARLAELRAGEVECGAATTREVEDLGAVEVAACRRGDADLPYNVYSWRRGDTLYVAEGLAGYDSALQLGLRTLVADRPVPGEVSVAITEAGDAAAFARVQAGTLDPRQALSEAYRRNNAGRFAESAEFFADILRRGSAETQAEALVNRALQQSNLGQYAEAESLFERAERTAADDPVMARMLRNYRAIHYLNRRHPGQALAELDRLPPAPMRTPVQAETLVIDAETAARLNSETGVARQLDAASNALLPEERIQILDGQAEQLRGTAHRLQGRTDAAVTAINGSIARLAAIRGGRVRSTMWMRAQLLSELASIAEERGDRAEAERQHQAAIAMITAGYPESLALLNAQARLAGFYARTGQVQPALELYGRIVDANAESGGNSANLRRTLTPYFALLVEQSTPESVAAMFKASQVLVRPGVAQTQAVLARELSGGSDEAARLFRQSVTLTRDIERARIELARLEAFETPTDADLQRTEALRGQLGEMQEEQTATQARLADFPRYRVVSGNSISLPELQGLLQPGEAYYKMMVANGDAYGIFVTRETARAFRIGATPAELDRQVDALRGTISVVENNQNLTYPFDLELAHRLYQQLFGPVSDELAQSRHLIFEPDGAMLRLPPNLLVMDRAAIDAYQARTASPDADAFDFRGIAWLGRERDISTAVSARAFRDGRRAPASNAQAEYIGFGENQPVSNVFQTATTGTRSVAGGADCAWPLFAWNRPISADELNTARRVFVASPSGEAEVVTGSQFTDTNIKRREDLDEFRILHFATHGLVSGPRPQCPAQPALMTSFGGDESDGLLTFSEIFDLRLDADIVILSACDTAGHGSRAAAEAAGGRGGEYALDGRVRAFVGAGGRMVIASHWPVPVDFDATQRLISGLFTAPPGTGTAAALRQAELALMERPETSHPYYWAGFAVVGDGAVPVIRSDGSASTGGN
ncbi:MAG: CHAT domain-containing protein [Allosphingosinicella sp.]